MSEEWGPVEFALQNWGGALRVQGREYEIDEWRLECIEGRCYIGDLKGRKKQIRGPRWACGKLDACLPDCSCVSETAIVRLDDGQRAWSVECIITEWQSDDTKVSYVVTGAISPDPWTEFALKA